MAGAAIAGALAAFMGLNTWKTQSIWHADNELARKLLLSIYQYRETLYAVRHPAMLNQEMAVEDEEAENLNDAQLRRLGVRKAYQRRWERHFKSQNALQALLLESDVVWGPELSNRVARITDLQRELFRFIRLHLDAHYSGDTELAAEYRRILRQERDILFDIFDDERDDFRRDFLAALEPAQEYLRGKLGRAT